MMFCRRCGAEIKPGGKFCGRCGAQVTGISSQPRSQTATPTTLAQTAAVAKQPTPVATPLTESAPTEVETPVSSIPREPPQQEPVTTAAESAVPKEKSRSHALLGGVLAALAVIIAAGVVYFLRSPGTVSDTDIVQNVKAAFFSDVNLRKCAIEVTAQNGTVTLAGFVNTDADKTSAVHIASQQLGVKQVVSQLGLREGATSGNLGSPGHPKKAKQEVGRVSEEAEQTGGQEAQSAVVGDPVITSVSPIYPLATQTIVIRGTGLGQHDPFNGYTPFLRVTDITQGNWVAGWSTDRYPNPLNQAPIYVSSWRQDHIMIRGFGGYGGYDARGARRVFQIGDVVKIEVANPQKQGLLNPSNPDFLGAPVAQFFATVSDRIGGASGARTKSNPP